MNSKEVLESAVLYLDKYFSCDCGQKGLSACDYCSEYREAIIKAWIVGVSAGTGILIAEDGHPDITPGKIYSACKEAIKLVEITVKAI